MNLPSVPLSWYYMLPTAFVFGFIGAALIDNHFRPYQGRLRPKAPEANAARWSRP